MFGAAVLACGAWKDGRIRGGRYSTEDLDCDGHGCWLWVRWESSSFDGFCPFSLSWRVSMPVACWGFTMDDVESVS